MSFVARAFTCSGVRAFERPFTYASPAARISASVASAVVRLGFIVRNVRNDLNYGRLLGTLEAFQVTYHMAASVLRGLATQVIVLDRRHRARQEKAEEPCS